MTIAIVLLIVAAIAVTAIVFKRKYDRFNESFPEEAKVENLRKRYHELLENLKAAVDSSDTELSLLNGLQTINYPEETLFVSLVRSGRNEEDGISIIDRTEALRKASKNSVRNTHNDGGYGCFDDMHFFILHHETKKYHDSCIVLWFESDDPIVTVYDSTN